MGEEPVSGSDVLVNRREMLGRGLEVAGTALLPAAMGAAAGYYAADQGMRWLPTMLELLLGAGALAAALLVAGRVFRGKATRNERGAPLRKRVVLAISLGMVLLIARLAVFWVERPSPLTELSAAEFEDAFAADARAYREHDDGIGRLVASLESHPEMFSSRTHVLTPDEEALLLDVWSSLYDQAFALDQIRAFYEDWYRFDPSRAERSYFLRSYLLSYGAELALYEKATRFVALVDTNPNAVKFLDAPHEDRGFGEGSFADFRRQLQGSRDVARVLAGDRYRRVLAGGLGAEAQAWSLGVGWMWERIDVELATLDELGAFATAEETLESDLELLKSGVRRTWYPAQKGVAEWMGDTRVRRIGRYLIDDAQREELVEHLEPGDIMIARKNWYLSNVGLPGFWPHAILYTGTPEDLEAYFNADPQVQAWVEERAGEKIAYTRWLERRFPAHMLEFRAGRKGETFRTIEAVSEGVVFSDLAHVTGDYTAALRPRVSKLAKAQAIAEAFDHLDKPYDFNFDFATDHALVCTELVWRAYRPRAGKEGLDVELVSLAGRRTLPAHELAAVYARERGEPDRQMDFVYFLDASEHEGKALVADEAAFVETVSRSKWDIAQQ